MKIILLEGPGSQGKTSTLKDVYNDLINTRGAKNKQNPIPVGSSDFEYMVCYNNKQVAICTQGDTRTYCIDVIMRYSYVDVIILARNSDAFLPFIQPKPEYSHHTIIQKTVASGSDQQAKANATDRDTIIRYI